jgi:hypothetical protein
VTGGSVSPALSSRLLSPRASSPRASSRCPLLIAAAFLAAAIFSGASSARIRLEGEGDSEHPVQYGNVGGREYTVEPCSYASGGNVLEGMDADGDYLEWNFSVEGEFCFAESLRSAGSLQLVRTFVVTIRDEEDNLHALDTLVTRPGLGTG